MTVALRLALGASVVCGSVLLPAAPALADEPDKTGWWNRVTLGGTPLPAPTTAEGDLRISNAPDGPAAYAAVLYPSFGATEATLALAVRPGRTAGTPDVMACPTVDTAWPEGGNQPFDKAPEFDCANGVFGDLAPDGTSLTFFLDSSTQDAGGVWSLALVPSPESTSPFTLDLAAPGPEAFTTSGGEDDTFTSEPSPDSGSDPAPPAPGGTEGGSGEAFLPGGFDAAPPPADLGGTGAVDAPLLAGEMPAAAADPAAPAPAVASGAAPAAQPLILARPAAIGEDLGAGRRLLALLVLAGGSAAVGYAAGQQRPGPRLIGGRSRAGVPAAVPAGPAVPSPQERPRGIGRFAKDRTEAPRRLR